MNCQCMVMIHIEMFVICFIKCMHIQDMTCREKVFYCMYLELIFTDIYETKCSVCVSLYQLGRGHKYFELLHSVV
jgi:hypothetical protein